jgi:isocitrate dehydrogenase kinase/phosphatase
VDAVERLGLYRSVVDRTVAELGLTLAERIGDRGFWARLKADYRRVVAGRPDRELAETFFNSVTRRVFPHSGVDPAVDFVEPEALPSPSDSLLATVSARGTSAELVLDLLRRLPFRVPYRSLEADAAVAGAEVDRAVTAWPGPRRIEAAEMLSPVFYRNKGAYLVGRLRGTGGQIPLILCLVNEGGGVSLDAVLLDHDAAAIVFSFTHSYFHVDLDRPREVAAFLRSILPSKRVAEIYTSLGYDHHGKTELYRDLRQHLRLSGDRFEVAPGERGMVMAVFTLPSYDVVFKVIKDRFPEPKSTSRQEVMERYDLVFKHDRAGRLVDAQPFEHLEFERDRFEPRLLADLLENASGSVSADGSRVRIGHLYTERRLTPLDLYLRQRGREDARAAVVDYGQAIRDLAATNIFPGDILTKNFGVTRHGRVVFYDYDELGLLSQYRFREMPEASCSEDELRGEPWFYVAENDIFPEEFLPFLGLSPFLRDVFLDAHSDLLTARFWRERQERLRAGEILDVFPYAPDRRLAAPARN